MAGGPQLPPIRSLNELSFTSRSPNTAESPVVFAPNPTTIPSLRHLHTPVDQPSHGYHSHRPMPQQQYYHQQPTAASNALSDAKSSASLDNNDLAADVIKVARNWSRDETLSLVRAIGRHYDSLKRCKTNQERSNVWHRIHKEHSSQFPGRSKKASQDRWGKVLSDYKDVMIHNKEKGAARWTFDFFKEVANIVDGDPQFMEVSSPSTLSPPSMVANTGIRAGIGGDQQQQQQQQYIYGGGSSTSTSISASTSMGVRPPQPPPPYTYHRMSEPNLSIRTQQIQGLTSSSVSASARPLPSASAYQKKKPMHEVHSAGLPQGSVFGLEAATRENVGRMPSSTRRTSYPQMQMHMQRSSAIGSVERAKLHQHETSPPLSLQPSTTANTLSCIMNYSMDSVPLSHGLSSIPDNPDTQMLSENPLLLSAEHYEDPEKACRYALEMLELQMRKIDAQQEELSSLRRSTRNTISRVEQMMDHYNRN
ncbi:hypothetical protein FB645_005551 [Coemansia sp. IMI 203386]|nr:hypothetical protein FB645_005551 [Coemansia sp. IMI 203386]